MTNNISKSIDEIVKRLAEGLRPEKIILFGSQAWGIPNPDSDVDIMVIVLDSDVSPAKRAAKAYGLLRGIKISKDILVKTRAEFDKFKNVKASLESKIDREGIVLYG